MAEYDRFDRMLKEYKTLLPQMSKHFAPDCALTAEAVWKYFRTGIVSPARNLTPGFQSMQCGQSYASSLAEIQRTLSRNGHGAHGVVTTLEDVQYYLHNFNALNIRGKIYFVDAYWANDPILTGKLDIYLAGLGKPIEFSRNWDIRLVPADRVNTYKC